MKKKIKSSQKGFTLLETLVAIFILTLAITGPVYISSVAFHNTIDSRDNISAQYIAEEVIEVIRNKRDKKALELEQPDPLWLSALLNNVPCVNEPGDSDNKCVMTRQSDGNYVFSVCNGGICPRIPFYPDGTFSVYGEDGVLSTSKFTREFYIQKETLVGSDTSGVKLVVNIKWTDKGRPKIYTLEERLYNINYSQFFIPEGKI
jgi:prepilin-type N-terminal cleavage/methylation domain-containing protein